VAEFFKTSTIWVVDFRYYGRARRLFKAFGPNDDVREAVTATLHDLYGERARLVEVRKATEEEELQYGDPLMAIVRPLRKLDMQGVGWGVVLTLLDWRWSPQQIAGTLKRVFPKEPERHVSHETIYTAIYAQPRGELRRQLIACLRRGRNTRMPRTRGDDRRGQIPEMVSIHVRPPEVDDRVMPGHWEGDFIKGAGNQSSVGVLVERTSRLVLLAKMDDATAASALAGFSDRGRDAHCWAPPAQIRTCPIRAYGSYLGCVTAKRWCGQG